MRWLIALLALMWVAGGGAAAADLKVLRKLSAAEPTLVTPLPAGSSVRQVQFARIVIHPNDLDWALAYESFPIRGEGDSSPSFERLPWTGRLEDEEAAFARAFEAEIQKAGFKADGASSLFSDGASSGADLKVGVLIDDVRGRFCVDCPNLFNRNTAPATVLMTAHWEVYSSLDRRVVLKVTTSGGVNSKSRVQGTVLPTIMDAYRENVRQLAMSDEFRKLLTTSSSSLGAATSPPSLAPLTLAMPTRAGGLAGATRAVAVVFAADGSGSGFLISDQGHVLTNQHVVGGSKYVKLKWDDGTEGLGEVVRVDTRRDVALIKAEAKGRAPLSLLRERPSLGSGVFAIGSPLGEKYQNSLTKGVVSGFRTFEGLTYIQSDVAINHGNSGGPLVNEQGAVVGISVSGIDVSGAPIGLNFFIPIEDALKALAIVPAG